MKRADALENYEYFTTSLSSLNRQLAFAGIAVIWVAILSQSSSDLTNQLTAFSPIFWFVSSMVLDLFHYIYASLAWGLFHRLKDKPDIPEDEDFTAPDWINWPSLLLFWAKVIAVCIGYIKLLGEFHG